MSLSETVTVHVVLWGLRTEDGEQLTVTVTVL
jgi:hypothetical protein